MAEIITVHSYHGGTGKTTLAANLATLLALRGYRVGLLDVNFSAPSLHEMFGLDEKSIGKTLVNYLWKECPIEAAAVALHERDDALRPFLKQTNFWLVPGSLRVGESAKILREGYDVGLLNDGIQLLVRTLALDYLVVDTEPGMREEMLLMMAISDTMVLLMRPIPQDYQGTGVLVEVAHKLEIPKLLLVVTNVTSHHDADKVKQGISATYKAPLAGLLPLSEDVAWFGNGNIFAVLYPDHPWSKVLNQIAADVISPAE